MLTYGCRHKFANIVVSTPALRLISCIDQCISMKLQVYLTP